MTREEAIRILASSCIPGSKQTEALETLIPELAESEDERIRKWLLDFAIGMIAGLELDISRSTYDGIKGHDPESKAELAQWQKARAYLEKQKEQKPVESISQLTVQGKGVYKICPRCKERMVRDDSMVYTSMPPQYRYECPKCGESECDTVMYDNPEMEEQKPVEWSEEDWKLLDEVREHIIGVIGDKPDLTPNKIYDGFLDLIDRLKFAKPQLKQEWSKEDKDVIDEAAELALSWGCPNLSAKLKSILSRVKPAEWSEEDERMLSRCVKSIESSKQFADSDTFKKAKDNEIDWLENRLKSLRPQPKRDCKDCAMFLNGECTKPHWKPSEEQEPEYYQHFDPDC